VTGGDKELQSYLQRAIGYTLTGSVHEEVAYVMYGSGNNGKSNFRETLHVLFGSYALAADAGLLTEHKTPGGATEEIARLKGCRFVAVFPARLSCNKAASRSSPMRWRQRVIEERSSGCWCRKNSSPQKYLIIRVLDPVLAHDLVAEVVGVLENGEPRLPCRQGRLAGAILVDRAKLLLQAPSVDRTSKLH
jgi:hypothetical protein